jgi:hypothetical protein
MGKSTISMAIFNDLQAPRHRSGIFRFPGARTSTRRPDFLGTSPARDGVISMTMGWICLVASWHGFWLGENGHIIMADIMAWFECVMT